MKLNIKLSQFKSTRIAFLIYWQAINLSCKLFFSNLLIILTYWGEIDHLGNSHPLDVYLKFAESFNVKTTNDMIAWFNSVSFDKNC